MSDAMNTLPRWLGGALTHRVARLRLVLGSAPASDESTLRWRRIFVSLGRSLCSRAMAMACTLAMVPLAIGYLGAERYGIWVTLTGFVSMLSFFDCGVGVGLQNRVAELMGKGQLYKVSTALRSAWVVLATISALVFGVLALTILKTGWVASAFHSAPFAQIDLEATLLLILGAFLLGLPFGLLPRMAFGLQQGWIASLAASVGTALTLAAVFVASLVKADFTAFVAFTVLPPLLAHGVSFALLKRHTPDGLSLFGPVSISEGLQTLRKGSAYILPQLVGAIVSQSPLVLLGALSTPVNATIYNVFTRISLPFQQLQQMFLDQVWPAITEALHRGDVAWLRTTLRRLLRSTLVFSVGATGAVTVAVYFLFPLLTRSAGLEPALSLVVLFAAQVGAMSILQGFVYMANGLSRPRLQNYFAVVCIVHVTTVLPYATRHGGIEGLLIASLLLNAVVALPLFYRDYARHLAQIQPR